MLPDRIIATVKFFDIQNVPVTALEVYKYLVVSPQQLREKLSGSYELVSDDSPVHVVGFDTVLVGLSDMVARGQLVHYLGHYCLPGRQSTVTERLRNHRFGMKRELRINRWATWLRYAPFVRGVGITGSQALGQERQTSDIDLLLFTDARFMWTARTFVTGWFQLFGMRRYGKKIANRFCLNHYVAGDKVFTVGRNLYTALEYSKLRPVVFGDVITKFKQSNTWLNVFFPHVPVVAAYASTDQPASRLQKVLERLWDNPAGRGFEELLAKLQMQRIRQGKYIVVEPDELSFHPDSKETELLKRFFGTPVTAVGDIGVTYTVS